MRLSVLYAADGSILSVMRPAPLDASDEAGASPPQVMMAPAEGQRLATVDVDPEWERRPLEEIHEAFTVVEGDDAPRLQPRRAAT